MIIAHYEGFLPVRRKFVGEYRLGGLLEKFFEIGTFEKSIDVYWITPHGNISALGPFAECVLCNTKNFCGFGNLHIVSELGHLWPLFVSSVCLPKSTKALNALGDCLQLTIHLGRRPSKEGT